MSFRVRVSFDSGKLSQIFTSLPSSTVTHPRLTLASGCSVTFLITLLLTSHDLLSALPCETCQLYTIRGTKSALRELKQEPYIDLSNEILLATGRGPGSFQRECALTPPPKSLLFCNFFHQTLVL
ncbi:hypothetical protein NA56DRAFT_644328 [Hyaloscypha hepaticicola]|uniref:Uncharacterized protein n=1 Tax=Hyaloscypha hepaticicola TaxID=2082293 RepID=A0A2J6QB36_9HELO|nr:hypothetical protein NA56DRAFT_644328 [Hyaloscypha hepaticicola]